MKKHTIMKRTAALLLTGFVSLTAFADVAFFTTEKPKKIGGHSYLDLGLPSGLKWATCNLGAESATDPGYYFAWGEISPKSEYTKENCTTLGLEISDISGNPQYDAAAALWGEGWRMPTYEEVQELMDNCRWTWMIYCGKPAFIAEGFNYENLILPAAGDTSDDSDQRTNWGCYWSSTPSDEGIGAFDKVDLSRNLRMLGGNENEGIMFLTWPSPRFQGMLIRPVHD